MASTWVVSSYGPVDTGESPIRLDTACVSIILVSVSFNVYAEG